jgi:hypothetical protein
MHQSGLSKPERRVSKRKIFRGINRVILVLSFFAYVEFSCQIGASVIPKGVWNMGEAFEKSMEEEEKSISSH